MCSYNDVFQRRVDVGDIILTGLYSNSNWGNKIGEVVGFSPAGYIYIDSPKEEDIVRILKLKDKDVYPHYILSGSRTLVKSSYLILAKKEDL